MNARVRRWGNSATVRIPSAVLRAAKLKLGDAVSVREEDGRIVIEPVGENHGALAALLVRITPENQHREMDFGARAGRESM
ncbi:MAG: AbrB/MazE/SpoVT family DNA-binding domain-containing protein [Xanthomonadales bacterium]|nr:AbrB/MazE/SpoVT family DNA-binding domain-containing protein [Xanthomonadales bacterium]